MNYGWIVDVLADLQRFAQVNGLPRLAASLADVQRVAVAETAGPAEETAEAKVAQGFVAAGKLSGHSRTGPRA